MTLNIRPAEPRDVEQAVPLIYSAGPEGFEFVFTQGRRRAQDYIAYAFTQGDGMFGHRNHTVIEQDGMVVGTGAFYSGVEYKQLSEGTLRQVLRFYHVSCLPVLRRALQTTQWMPPPGRRTLYVANLGVATSHRGQGLGAQLLVNQIARARAAHKTKFALDVAATNPRAQLLYERLGLRVVRENGLEVERNGIRLPRARRMELML